MVVKEIPTQRQRDKVNHGVCRSSRLFTAGMCFLILFCIFALRLNMSVAIVCMVNHTALQLELAENNGSDWNTTQLRVVIEEPSNITSILDLDPDERNYTSFENIKNRLSIVKNGASTCGGGNKSLVEENRKNGPFMWNKADQGLILNSFYWGYIVCMLPSGWLVNRFNPVRVLGICSALSSILCLFIPLIASNRPVGLVIVRVLTGCMSGVFFPGIQNVLAKWVPPSRLGSLGSFAFMGNTCGATATFILSGYLCQYGFADGWQSVFYVHGVFCLAISFAWLFFVHEYPADSQFCLREKEGNDKHHQKNSRPPIAWKSLLTSKPVFATVACAVAIDVYGTICALYLPTYFADVMNFKITSNGILSSLPFISKSVMQFSGGLLSDLMYRKTTMSLSTVRKSVNGTGQIICAASITIVGFLSCDYATLAVVLMVLSQGGVGIICIAATINPIDIAGVYSGIIMAVSNFISNTMGLIAASVTTALINENPSRESWQIVFIMAAFVLLVSFILFSAFASGLRQPWAATSTDVAEVDMNLYPDRQHKNSYNYRSRSSSSASSHVDNDEALDKVFDYCKNKDAI